MPRISFDEKQSPAITAIGVTTEKHGTQKKGYMVDLTLRQGIDVEGQAMKGFIAEYADKAGITVGEGTLRLSIPPHHPYDHIAQSLSLTLAKHGLMDAGQAGRMRTELSASKERTA